MKHPFLSKITFFANAYKGFISYRKALSNSRNKELLFHGDSPKGYPITSRRPNGLFVNPLEKIMPEAYALIIDGDYEFIYVNSLFEDMFVPMF